MKRWMLAGVAFAAAVIMVSLGYSMPMLRPSPGDVADIELADGYVIEKVVTGLTFPTSLALDGQGSIYIAEAGWSYGPKPADARVLRVRQDGRATVLVAGLNGPVNGITYHEGYIYISHRGTISRIAPGGTLEDLITCLPSLGDHHNNDLVFGPDGKLYFGQGTATNAGVVGHDSFVYGWANAHPQFHDHPARDVQLAGVNYTTVDLRTLNPVDTATTGAFVPFGTRTTPGQVVPGRVPASGTIMRADPGGQNLEVHAWGLRNPYGLRFDAAGNLWCTNHGYDDRGVRPVANSPDFLYRVVEDGFYGWPDYVGTEPVTAPHFQSPTGPELAFLLQQHPAVEAPVASFPAHSGAMKFDFSPGGEFGFGGHVFVALFGNAAPTMAALRAPVGSRVVRVDPATGRAEDFAANRFLGRAGIKENGFNRPIDVKFSPDGSALYVLDFGVLEISDMSPNAIGRTGILWKISRQP
ncbi:MAG: PQQ-dependent sugar dehydrogenase [Bacillota bacterium]